MPLLVPRDLDHAREILRALDPLSRAVVQLLAIFHDPTTRSDLAAALGRMGHRIGGRAPGASSVLPVLSALEERGLVDGTSNYVLSPDFTHVAMLTAFAEGVFTAMSKAVIVSRYSDDPRPRELRLALYAGRWEDARRHVESLGTAAFHDLCRPFDRRWVASLPPDLRTRALRAVLHSSMVKLDPAPAAFAMLEAEPELDDAAHRVLVEQLVLRGRLDDADRLLAGRTSSEAQAWRAAMLFLRGRRAEAIAAYDAALRVYLRRAGKRAVIFPDRAGALFLVALLDEDRSDGVARAKALAEAAKRPGLTEIPHAYTTLSDVASRRSDERTSPFRYLETPSDPFERLLQILADVWLDLPVPPAHLTSAERLIPRAVTAGYTWLAGQLTAALARAGHGGAYEELYAALPGVRLADLLRTRPEPWAHALDMLSEIAAKQPARAVMPRAPEPERRLAWFVSEHPYGFAVEPREQVHGKGGYSGGRPVALKRLYTEGGAMSFLRHEDRLASLAIREETVMTYGRYRDVHYVLDPRAALRALVGHPAVFVERAGGHVAAEIRLGRARLRAEQTATGLHLALDPMPGQGEEEIVVRRLAEATFEVIELDQHHHAVARALGPQGLDVPASASTRVHGLLEAISGIVDVDAEIDAASAEPGDPRPTVILRPLGGGISAEIVIRPLGALGPIARPGEGGAVILADVGGKRRKAARDLPAEARLRDDLVTAFPALAGGAIPDRDRALEAIAALHALGDRVAVEWPEGEALRVSAEITAAAARFSVRCDEDEIAVDGALVLPDGRRVELAEILGYLAASPGRFLQLAGDPQYLALHADLRRRLADLAALGGARRTRIPSLLAPLLDDLLAGAEIDADEAFRRRLEAFAPGPEADVPKTLRADLRPYQIDGFRWLARLGRIGAGACLADDMGLGKTVQVLALLLLHAPEGPSLVVAPTSVVPGWIDEAARFAPTLRPRAFAGEGRAAILDDLAPLDLVVTSYALLQQDVEKLAAVSWNAVILDEAQAIKNAETLRARAACQLHARRKIALTGTPVENRLDDLHGIFRFLAPSLLGSAEAFAARFARPIERDPAARDRLRRVVGPFLLRRTKSDVLPELPARTEVMLHVTLSKEEIALYDAIRAEALTSLVTASAGAGRRRIQILAAITRLRRAASHPRLVLPEAAAVSAKIAAFGELLDEILPGGHRVLVFSQFVDHLALLRGFLDERGIAYQHLEGSTHPAQRKAAIDAFQAGLGDVFLISLRAGGFGLNLTGADYVVHMDPWWNPAVEDQASDRAHRLGQTRPVTIYRLVARDTIEDQILALHHKKRDLAEGLLEGSDAAARMSEEELLALLRAEVPQAASSPEAAPRTKTRRAR